MMVYTHEVGEIELPCWQTSFDNGEHIAVLNSFKSKNISQGTITKEFEKNQDCTSPNSRDWPKDWTAQTKILYDYAFRNNLKLISSEETGVCDTWNVFVSNDLPLSLVTKSQLSQVGQKDLNHSIVLAVINFVFKNRFSTTKL